MVDYTYTLDSGDALHSLDWNNTERTLHGFGVTDGCDVTINTGTLGTGNDALSVASGSAVVDRVSHNVSSQAVSLAGADDLPRWDVVGVDTSGSVVVLSGTPEEAQIDGETTTETHRSVHKPIPPFDATITPLALVWIGANAGSVDSGDLFDVRVPTDVHAASISGPVASGSSITDLTGANLSENGGSLEAADMRTDVQDDGTSTVTGTTTLNFASGLSVTDPGDGSATIDGTIGDSQPEIRNAANFSGADGGEQIQAAINDLPAEGGTVWVPAVGPDLNNRWTVSSHILLESDVRLESNGALLFLADTSDDNIIMTNESEGDTVVENAHVEGFYMDGNRANNGQWTRPDGTAVNPACVFALESDQLTVRDCHFTSSRGYGVKFALSTNGYVTNCYSADMGDDGFTVTDTLYSAATSAYNHITQSLAENNTDAGFEVDDGPIYTKFSDCVSVGNTEGFDAHTHDTAAPDAWSNVSYANCTARGNTFGWKLGANNTGSPSGVFCQNITVENSSEAAFSAGASGSSTDSVPTEVYVDGFKFDHPASATEAAIDLRSPNGVSRWSFSNGFITTGRRAVNGDSAVSGMTLQNVDMRCGAMTIAESGVEFNAGSSGQIDNIHIVGCTVRGAQNSGIQMWTGGGQLTDVRIIGGTYANNGQGNTNSSGAAGISINENGGTPNRIVVAGTRCYDTQGAQETGIWWDGVANSVFALNILIGNNTTSTDGTLASTSTASLNIT